MNLDDPIEVIRWALRHAANDRIVDVMGNYARTVTDAQDLASRCEALADDPTLGGLLGGNRITTVFHLDHEPAEPVASIASPWPTPQPGTHESDLVDLGGPHWWGPAIARLPGTALDATWFAAMKWSRSNRKGAAG